MNALALMGWVLAVAGSLLILGGAVAILVTIVVDLRAYARRTR